MLLALTGINNPVINTVAQLYESSPDSVADILSIHDGCDPAQYRAVLHSSGKFAKGHAGPAVYFLSPGWISEKEVKKMHKDSLRKTDPSVRTSGAYIADV